GKPEDTGSSQLYHAPKPHSAIQNPCVDNIFFLFTSLPSPEPASLPLLQEMPAILGGSALATCNKGASWMPRTRGLTRHELGKEFQQEVSNNMQGEDLNFF
ncbi:hypothetical protein VaNZ11_016359, partial [Volvox africanus]